MPSPGAQQPLETIVLWSVYDSLQQELTRISNLIEKKSLPSKDAKDEDGAYERVSFLEDYLDKVGDHFNSRIRTARNDLRNIKRKIGAGQPADLTEAWNLCVRLRTETVAPLSSELLALIGGAFLQATRLDSVKEPPDDEGQAAERGPSFSELSRDLVKALADHSQLGSKPVLIVGEEYLGAGEAELIRLRFPACDIWNLPLAAHEYGYLAATKQSWVPPAFADLRKEVRERVRPAFYEEHGGFPQQEDAACYLEEIRREWELYQGQELDRRKDYCDERNSRFAALEDQQEHYLCHLFADAFATFYVGPAYVHALLNLRFIPERLAPSSPYVPPFTHRFVFALETLKWMQKSIVADGLLDTNLEDYPFESALPEQAGRGAGLYDLWQKALKSAGQPDTYGQTLRTYGYWYGRIKSYFVDQPEHLALTYANWRSAVALREHLLNDPMVIPATVLSAPVTPAKKWAVLNAAWSARWLYPDKLDTITANVHRLFDPQDTGWCESASGSRARTIRGAESDTRQAAIAQIIAVMVELGLTDLTPKFATMTMTDDEKKQVYAKLQAANKNSESMLFSMLTGSR